MNRKIIYCLLLIIAAVFSSCSKTKETLQAVNYADDNDFEIINNGESVIISGYIGSKTIVNIPPVIQGKPVIGIGKGAFERKTDITEVTIPKGVISIGEEAFALCESLAIINIPNSVTIIEDQAFIYCCLNSVTIPENVISIGWLAFAFNKFINVNIPYSVIDIRERAFWGDNLVKINVDKNNTAYSSDNGILYNKNKTILLQYPAGKTNSSFTIPNSVTNIGDYSFFACKNLESITIPDNVIDIEFYAFGQCDKIKSITIGNSVQSIGAYAFRDCNLTGIIIPNSVTSIGKYAFEYCGLTKVVFERNFDWDCSEYAFYGDLLDKYSEHGRGTYITKNPGTRATWEYRGDL